MPIVPLPKTFADEYAQGQHVPQSAAEVVQQELIEWGFVSEDPQKSLLFHGTTFTPLPSPLAEEAEALPLNQARSVEDYLTLHALGQSELQRKSTARRREFVENAQARKAEASQIASSVLDALVVSPQPSAARRSVSTWWDRNPVARPRTRPLSIIAIVDGDMSDYDSESADEDYEFEDEDDDYESEDDAPEDFEYALALADCATPALTTDDESYADDEFDADVCTPALATFAVQPDTAAKSNASPPSRALERERASSW